MTVILPRNDHISRISPKKGNWFWTSTVSTGWDMWSFLQDELSHFACTWILLGWTFLEVAWRPPESALWIGHVLRSQEGAEAAAQEIFGWMVVFSASKLDQPICSFRVAMSSDEDHSEQWPIRISWNVIRALNVAPVFFLGFFLWFFSLSPTWMNVNAAGLQKFQPRISAWSAAFLDPWDERYISLHLP